MHSNRLLGNSEKPLPAASVVCSGKIPRLYPPVAITRGRDSLGPGLRLGSYIKQPLESTKGSQDEYILLLETDCGTAEEKGQVKNGPAGKK